MENGAEYGFRVARSRATIFTVPVARSRKPARLALCAGVVRDLVLPQDGGAVRRSSTR